MAGTDREIAIVVKATVDGLVSGMASGEAAVEGFAEKSVAAVERVESSMEGLKNTFRALMEAFIGVEIIKQLADIAGEADRASKALENAALATKNLGKGEFPVDAATEWAEALARSSESGGASAAQIKKAFEDFAVVGATYAQSQRLIVDATKLSIVTGKDFETTERALVMAAEGHGRALQRLGIQTVDAAGKMLPFKTLIAEVEAAEKGATNSAYTQSVSDLGEAFDELKDAIGTDLEPVIEGIANALTRLLDAVKSINPEVLRTIVVAGALVLGMVSLAAIVPAVVKGFELVSLGAKLFLSAGEAVVGILSGALVGAFRGVTAALEFLRAAFMSTAVAEFALETPVALIIAGMLLLGIAVEEMVKHWDSFSAAGSDALKNASSNVKAFVDFVGDQFKSLGKMFEGIWKTLNGDKSGIGEMQSGFKEWSDRGDEATAHIVAGMKHGIDDASGYIKGKYAEIAAWVSGLFSSTAGKGPKTPMPSLDGLGGAQKPGKDTSVHDAGELYKSFVSAIDAWLDKFTARVDQAKDKLTRDKAAADAYDAQQAPGRAQTSGVEAQKNAFLEQQRRDQLAIAATINDQAIAEDHAAAAFRTYANAIPPALKNHQDLVREAEKAAEAHTKAALALERQRDAAKLTAEQLTKTENENRVAGADTDADRANQEASRAASVRQEGTSAMIAGITNALKTAELSKQGTGFGASDQAAVQIAALQEAAAKDTEAAADEAAARAANLYSLTATEADRQKMVAAEDAARTAHTATITAENAATIAGLTLQQANLDRFTSLGQAVDGLVQKLNVPGLTKNAGNQGFTLDPMAMLMQLFEQTASFADIMRVVNGIMQTFVQVLNALEPVIDALLRAVEAVINVFIMIYNAIATVLNLLGFQIQLLQSLNVALGTTVPLIQITHVVPTQNELAAGKLNNPLSQNPIGQNSATGGANIAQTLQSPSLGGGLLQGIVAIGVALLIERALHIASSARAAAASALASTQRAAAQASEALNFTAQTTALVTALGTGFASVVSAVTLSSVVPSFDVGAWNLPKNTLAMVHQGEMIVPAQFADTIRTLLGNGGLPSLQGLTVGMNPVGPGFPTPGGAAAGGAGGAGNNITITTQINSPTIAKDLDMTDLTDQVGTVVQRALSSTGFGISQVPMGA